MKTVQFNLNPIMVKELRSRMRGWRAFAMLTIYLIFLALFTYGVYRLVLLSPPYSTIPLSPFIGQSLFAAIANLSLFFVAFLTPALTATAISSEKEQLTLEMLQTTPLAPHKILFGKLISTTGYIFLLLFAAVPILSLVFIFGGVALLDLFLSGLVMGATAVTFGMVGLFFSAWRQRTIQAIVLSYLVVLFFVLGTYFIYIFSGVITQKFPSRAILVINPFSALASVLANTGDQNSFFALFGVMAGWGPWMSSMEAAEIEKVRPLWHYTLAFNAIFSTGLYLLATCFVRPIYRWRLNRRAVSVGIGLMVLIGILVALIFYQDVYNIINLTTPTPGPTSVPLPPLTN